MDLKTMRNESPEAITRAMAEALARLRELRFGLASNQVKHVRELRELRTQVARLQTVTRERAKTA